MKLEASHGKPMLTTLAAAEDLGITLAQFDRFVKRLGIEPDDTYQNPYYRSAQPARLWSRRTLAALKRRTAFREFVVGAASRSKSALSATETKVKMLVAECEAWKPDLCTLRWDREPWTLDVLVTAAVDAYNDRQKARDDYDSDYASVNSSPEFLDRITRNYIRHNLTDYDALLASIRGRAGVGRTERGESKSGAYENILRPKVDGVVADFLDSLKR
jgi:hypothetical protein